MKNMYNIFVLKWKPKVTSSNVLFCSQLNNIQFTVTEDSRNQNIFTLEELKSENLNAFS